MEMGSLVVIVIDDLDAHLPQRDPVPGRPDEDVHLILVPLPPDSAAPVQQLPRDPPQAGLGVPQAGTIQRPESPAGQPVPHLRLGGHLGQRQIPDPQNQLVRRLQRGLSNSANVLYAVLSVGVCRHYGAAGPPFLSGDVRKGVLHGPPLALVGLMAQDRTARHGLQLLKDASAGFPAAIVHHHNLLRPLFQKSRREPRKYLIRIQRRNDDHTAA